MAGRFGTKLGPELLSVGVVLDGVIVSWEWLFPGDDEVASGCKASIVSGTLNISTECLWYLNNIYSAISKANLIHIPIHLM